MRVLVRVLLRNLGKRVLNRRKLRVKLRRLVRLGNGGVMRGEMIPLETKKADPNFSIEINATKWVDH